MLGRHVLITGASQGIGFELVRLFSQEGWYVSALSRNVASLGSLKHVTAVVCDVSNATELRDAIVLLSSRNGCFDAVVVNAGVSGFAFVDAKEFQDEFARTFSTNVTAAVNTVVFSLPYLNPKRAALIAIGSVAATNEASPGLLHYSASKSAIRTFFHFLHLELHDRRIRTSVVSPGLVQTPLGIDLETKLNLDPASARLAPSDVAQAVLFLANYNGTGNISEIVLQPSEHNNKEVRQGWKVNYDRAMRRVKPVLDVSAAPAERNIAFVTGASRGIGLTLALRLARLHYHLVIVARDTNRLESAKDKILQAGASSCQTFECDVAEPGAVVSLLRSSTNGGRLSVLISCAGVNNRVNIVGSSEDVVRNTLATNLTSSAETCIEAAKIFHYQKTRGHIIIVGSTASLYPWSASGGMTPYYISKNGQLGLASGLREDLRPLGVKVSLLQLGLVDNELGNAPGAVNYLRDGRIKNEDVGDCLDYLLLTSETCVPSHITVTPHGSQLNSVREILKAKL